MAEKLSEELNLPEDTGLAICQYNTLAYWGAAGRNIGHRVYLGAIICFLFLFGADLCEVAGKNGGW